MSFLGKTLSVFLENGGVIIIKNFLLRPKTFIESGNTMHGGALKIQCYILTRIRLNNAVKKEMRRSGIFPLWGGCVNDINDSLLMADNHTGC